MFSVIETKQFSRLLFDYLTDDQYALLQKSLIEIPEQGAVVAGSGFGAPGHMRLSFACSLQTLEKAIERIRAVLPAVAQAKSA